MIDWGASFSSPELLPADLAIAGMVPFCMGANFVSIIVLAAAALALKIRPPLVYLVTECDIAVPF